MKWKNLLNCASLAFIFAAPCFAGVQVTSPTSGATVGSPVKYVASASTGCAKGVASMGVYVDNNLIYTVKGNSLNASLNISPGKHHTVVQGWDYCGGASFTARDIQVTTTTGVWVSSPDNNSTVGAPVHFVASASTASCGKGVAAMGVFVNSQLTYKVNGNRLDTYLMLYPGTYDTVVRQWDYCGGSSYQSVKVTVPGKIFKALQAENGWKAWGQIPPEWGICNPCGPAVTWKMTQGIQSPSLTGNATKFQIGGDHPYSDVLWTNSLIGEMSTQGIKDVAREIIPSARNFVYDIYFWGGNLEVAQVIEFDVNQYFNGMGFIYGSQCRIKGGHEFDIWDNVNWHWVPTGIPCRPKSNAWNHYTLRVQRTSDNKLRYMSLTLNGVTHVLDRYYPHFGVAGWYGIGVNFQLDGNYKQEPYAVVVDRFSLTYW